MRLTAQRVVSRAGQHGINSFYAVHGPHEWLDRPPDPILASPGELVESDIRVTPPGNRVRSFLEIVAPDDMPSRRIIRGVMDCLDLLSNKELPLTVESAPMLFTFNAERALALAWRKELVTLLEHAIRVRET